MRTGPPRPENEIREAAASMTPVEPRLDVESIPDAVVIVDARGRIVQVNAHTEALFGYDRSELRG
jgi:PAS domain-containing protein